MTATSSLGTSLERAFADGLVKIVRDRRGERIQYLTLSRFEKWSDPEEKVRAELWAELIYKYRYEPETH